MGYRVCGWYRVSPYSDEHIEADFDGVVYATLEEAEAIRKRAATFPGFIGAHVEVVDQKGGEDDAGTL